MRHQLKPASRTTRAGSAAAVAAEAKDVGGINYPVGQRPTEEGTRKRALKNPTKDRGVQPHDDGEQLHD